MTVLVPIAQGTEEMEAVIIVDILRRAGISVTLAGDNSIVTCSRKVKLLPDITIDEIFDEAEFEAIIIPGGATGVKNLSDNHKLETIVKNHASKNRLIGAICAAPLLLYQYKLLPEQATSHPGVKDQIQISEYSEDSVVVSGNIITSRGAGTAFQFALEIVRILRSEETSAKIQKDIVLNN